LPQAQDHLLPQDQQDQKDLLQMKHLCQICHVVLRVLTLLSLMLLQNLFLQVPLQHYEQQAPFLPYEFSSDATSVFYFCVC
jgi:hypothetical protein